MVLVDSHTYFVEAEFFLLTCNTVSCYTIGTFALQYPYKARDIDINTNMCDFSINALSVSDTL